MAKNKKIVLTQDQLDWIAEHYLETPREEVCAKFGFSLSHLTKVVNQLGVHRPKYRYAKGVNNLQRLGYEREMERRKKVSAKMKELWRIERARARFGLDRQTRLHVIPQPQKKLTDRYYLRKRGYILDEENLIAYWTPETKRSYTLERKPRRYYKFAEYPDL